MDAPEELYPDGRKPTVAEVLEGLERTQKALAEAIGRARADPDPKVA